MLEIIQTVRKTIYLSNVHLFIYQYPSINLSMYLTKVGYVKGNVRNHPNVKKIYLSIYLKCICLSINVHLLIYLSNLGKDGYV